MSNGDIIEQGDYNSLIFARAVSIICCVIKMYSSSRRRRLIMYKLKTDSPGERKANVDASETIIFKSKSKSSNPKAETSSNKLGTKKTIHISYACFSLVSPYRMRYIICGVLATGEMAIAFYNAIFISNAGKNHHRRFNC